MDKSYYGKDNRRHFRKYQLYLFVILPALPFAAASLAYSVKYFRGPISQTAISQTASQEVHRGVSQLLDDADAALKAGNTGLALFYVREAVRLAPSDGEARAQLGIMLWRNGQIVAAERELRQAIMPLQSQSPQYDLVIPYLLQVMKRRNELKELLAEFPNPPQGTREKVAPDILNARAFALQFFNRPVEARAAMDHSLAMRRDVDGLISSATLAQQQGNLALARNQTDEAIKLAPTNESALSRSLQLLRGSGDAQNALEVANEFVQRIPNSTMARLLRIEILLELKQDETAKQDVDVLLNMSPRFSQYYRGVLMARANDFQGAWIQLETLRPEFIQSLASVAMRSSSIAIASNHLNIGAGILSTFVANHPDDRVARLQLAAARFNQNAFQAALDALDSVKADDPTAQALLALAYLGLGRFDKAIASLEMVSSLPKTNNLLKQQLAVSQWQANQSEEISHRLRDIVDYQPGNVAIAAPLIAALIAVSKWDEALSVTEELAKRAPESPFPAFYEGQIFIARRNLAEAETAFSKALAIQSMFVPALYYRANVLVARGNVEAAKKDLQTLLALRPVSIAASIRLAEILLDRGQDEEALVLLNRTIPEAAPGDLTPRLALTNYFVGRRKYQDAQMAVTELLRVSPNDPEGQALQGQIQFLRGQTADAINSFRALATSNVSSPGAFALLARALYKSKDQFAAEEAARTAAEWAPNSAEMRMLLVEILRGGGKAGEALSAAQAYAISNPGPEADLLVADTLVRLERTKEAIDLLAKRLSEKPDSRVALRLSQLTRNPGISKKANAMLLGDITKDPDDSTPTLEYTAAGIKSGALARSSNIQATRPAPLTSSVPAAQGAARLSAPAARLASAQDPLAQPTSTAPLPHADAPERLTPAPRAIQSRSGGMLLQLGSFETEAQAGNRWRALKERFSVSAAGLSEDIQRADLGAKGIRYRLRVGPFPNTNTALAACETFKSQGGACLVIAP